MEFKRDPRFGRMIPAMVTPFNADLELDLDRLRSWPTDSYAAVPTPSSSTGPPARVPRCSTPRSSSCSAPWCAP